MREVIARVVDGSDLLEFKTAYGPGTVCAHANVHGMPVGFLTNNGRWIRPARPRPRTSSRPAAQSDIPLVYLQNTTGYIVGKESERAA